MTQFRQVLTQHIGQSASDGAGVRLTRVIGGAGIERFDPFLMLDEFGSENPDDCWRRPKTDPPCRLKIDPGKIADFSPSNCG